MWKDNFFKITFFASIDPRQLQMRLEKLKFTPTSDGHQWEIDGYSFIIEPFKNQPSDDMKGYRIYFNCNPDIALYLIDGVFRGIKRIVTSVEYTLSLKGITSRKWIAHLDGQPQCTMTDPRGLFTKNGVGLVVVNDRVILVYRKNTMRLAEGLKKVDSIREELVHSMEVGLFSSKKEKSG